MSSAQLAAGRSAGEYQPRLGARRVYSVAFLAACLLAIGVGIVLLAALIVEISVDGAARAFVGATAEGLPENLGWLAWALPLGVALPFAIPRLVARHTTLSGAAFSVVAVASVALLAVCLHLLYVRFEDAYYVKFDVSYPHVFAMIGDASAWQIVRIVAVGFLLPGGLLLGAALAAKRLRAPSIAWPLLIVAAFVVYLFVDPAFLSSYPSRSPDRAGIFAAVAGTLYMMTITAALAFPLGVGAAVYLEEYARANWFSRFIQVNISNLAGVPSIVYGLLGLQLFVRLMGFERSVLAGACTMALLVMPIIIVSAQEALRAVPPSMREAAYAVGATRWQVVRYHVLPYAFGGMLTGNILAMSRAIGETAPLIMIGALTFVAFLPDTPTDDFTVLPIQIFNWVSRAQSGFHEIAASAILVLLVILLLMNSTAIIMRQRSRTEW